MDPDMKSQAIEQAADAAVRYGAPVPVAVSGLSLYGIQMQDWVYLATFILTVGMVAEMLWKWGRAWKRRHDERDE